MKNKEKYNLEHLHIVSRPGKTRLDYCFKYVEIEYGGRIIKEYRCLDADASKKFFEWLEEDDEKECKSTILTEKEKAYLSAVIKPFREEVESIKKIDIEKDEQQLQLQIPNGLVIMDFPLFKKGAMYRGMEEGREYTLEELGL